MRIERLLPSRTRIADVWLSVISCAARWIVTDPSQNTGGLPISSDDADRPELGERVDDMAGLHHALPE